MDLFGQIGFAVQDKNPVKWFPGAGIGGRGMIPLRDNNTFGIGHYHTKIQENKVVILGMRLDINFQTKFNHGIRIDFRIRAVVDADRDNRSKGHAYANVATGV